MALAHENQKVWRVAWYWAHGSEPQGFVFCETKFYTNLEDWMYSLACHRKERTLRAWRVYVDELLSSGPGQSQSRGSCKARASGADVDRVQHGSGLWINVHCEDQAGDPTLLTM